MSGFDKKELKFLLRELKEIFATKKELEELDIDIDLDSIDVAYVGDEEPDNQNAIWFDSGEDNYNSITYDNPVVNEIFSCIRTLQDQVKQLQEDVEYLKLYGGGGGVIQPPSDDDEELEVNVILGLEDGGLFLLEDGGFMILEESKIISTTPSLSLEDGGLFLLENGGFLTLESSIDKINQSILLLENNAKMLFENGTEILLEK